jgi:hypothetical protein
MKLTRVDQFGKVVRLAEARKTYASVADQIKPDSEVVEALGQLMESMAKIAESRGEDSVGAEEITVAMERLASKGYRVEGSPEYFEANAKAIEEVLKTAGIGDWAGNAASWLAGKTQQGAEALQQAPGAAQQALQKGWQTAKDLAGKAVALPGQGLQKVKEKAQDVQVRQFEKAKQQMIQSLQAARSSFAAVQDVLAGKSNKINLPALRKFSTAMAALLNAANTLNARTQASKRPEAVGTVPGGKSVSAPAATPAAAPAAGSAVASSKKTNVRVAGFDISQPVPEGAGTLKDRVIALLNEAEEMGGPEGKEYIEEMKAIAAEATRRAENALDMQFHDRENEMDSKLEGDYQDAPAPFPPGTKDPEFGEGALKRYDDQ